MWCSKIIAARDCWFNQFLFDKGSSELSKVRKASVLRCQTDQGTRKLVLEIETGMHKKLQLWCWWWWWKPSNLTLYIALVTTAGISTGLQRSENCSTMNSIRTTYNLHIFIIQKLAHCLKFFLKLLANSTRVSWYPKLWICCEVYILTWWARPGRLRPSASIPLSRKNCQFVTDEPVEFEKQPVEVRDFGRITDHFRGICRIKPQMNEALQSTLCKC